MSDVPAEWADEPWDYSTAARSIALNLQEFCDESLPYPEMIADAARKAAAECARLREALRKIDAICKSPKSVRRRAGALVEIQAIASRTEEE